MLDEAKQFLYDYKLFADASLGSLCTYFLPVSFYFILNQSVFKGWIIRGRISLEQRTVSIRNSSY